MAGDYQKKAQTAVVWNIAFNLFRDVLQFIQMLVLARILKEAAYGQFAFATSVIGFIAVFSATSFMGYLIQVKTDDPIDWQVQFTASAVIQFLMFSIANLVGLALGGLPAFRDAAPLVHVLSFVFLLESTCELRRKMLERQFDFKSLRLLHAIGLGLSTLCGIVMAIVGCGAYSLVVPTFLVTIPFIWDLIITQGWRPNWFFSWSRFRPAFQFGLLRIGSGLSGQGRTLVEAAVLTSVIGFGSLGVVNRAVGLAQLACGKIASQLTYAIYPILTRLDKETGQVVRAGDLVVRLVAWSTIPIAVLLSCLAHPVVHVLYGPSWSGVVLLMKWTLLSAVVSSLAHVAYMLVLSRNRSKVCFCCDLLALAGTVLSLLFGLPFGVHWYLISQAVVHGLILTTLLVTLVMDKSLSCKGLLDAIVPSLFSAMLAAAIAYACTIASVGMPRAFWSSVVWGVLFGSVYLLTLRCIFTKVLLEMLQFFPAKRFLLRCLVLQGA